ncbi:DNA-binding transcriptional LysR family regulator [Williamsia limnetica]|jgi:DNA-binding transcriptional LysR family regulator|uniref:DNA-binding transcriptional LysR family regulator n=1 Tax=Williamsia limnetica TaxID=882452 RepID=A0A318RR70_WILLI|nr:LysR family transcriptional regulator [Williamsia limnetica]PYE18015.1 DNA-binding transcriptional LysR family regulator [Williamsia limnetica]
MVLPARVPDLSALDVVVSVARSGSMSAAAREQNLSQQAISSRVHATERELGVVLFRRSPSGTELTTEGVAVLEWAAGLLDAAEKFSAGIESLLGNKRASLTVAASMTIAEYLIPSWALNLRRLYPEARISVRPMNSADVAREVLARTVDLGFIEGPHVEPRLDSLTIGGDELVVVTRPEHPWATGTRAISGDELARTPLVQREPGSGTRITFEDAFGEVADPLLELTSVAAVKAAVLGSDAPAVLSSLSVMPELADGRLVRISVTGVRMPRRLRAVWDRSGGLHGPARDLVQLATQDGQQR